MGNGINHRNCGTRQKGDNYKQQQPAYNIRGGHWAAGFELH